MARSASRLSAPWTIATMAFLPLLAGGCAKKAPAPEASRPAAAKPTAAHSRDEALELFREGRQQDAVAVLTEIAAQSPGSRESDEANLALGAIQVWRKQDAAAIGPLERVVSSGKVGGGYADVLLARAIVNAGDTAKYELAEKRLASPAVTDSAASPVLKEAAGLVRTKLLGLEQKWPECADAGMGYLESFPKGPGANEVRWETAQALEGADRKGEAFNLYQEVWFQTPSSPWAKKSKERLAALASAPGAKPAALKPDERYEFVKALQRAGLHEDALAEIERYLASGGPKADGAFLLEAQSLHQLRKNQECVRVVEQMRSRFPRSPHLASAAIWAIKSFRRTNGEAEIRDWTSWINRSFPDSEKAAEARYNLGVFLLNNEKDDEGIEVLRTVQQAPGSENADDAAWKIAWAQEKAGRTVEAAATLKRLLDEAPDSAFRKATLFWLARFTAQSDPAGARSLLETLLREYPNDYYGYEGRQQLALLGGRGAVGTDLAAPALDTLSDPGRRPGDEAYARAVELKKVALFDFAAQELKAVPGIEKDPALSFALADLYTNSGNTWEAASILGRNFKEATQKVAVEKTWNDPAWKTFWRIYYPLQHFETIRANLVESGLEKQGIDPYLVAALIRMESRFLTTAVSHVGAVGLMQLMPDTAQKIAEELKVGPVTRDDLFNPEANIKYGMYFLANRVRDFNGTWFPAICSYNAGPGPVKSWLEKKPADQPQDEFIEMIPYIDTRIYVKQILGDWQNYRKLYGNLER